MTKSKLADFRRRLASQLAELSQDYDAHRKLRDYPENSDAREVVGAVAGSEKLLAAKITSALERIAEGTFGNCITCGGAIPIERIEAKPCVALCLACQEAKESV